MVAGKPPGRFGRRIVVAALAVALLALWGAAAPAGAFVYWANASSSATVGRANLDGSGVVAEFVNGGTSATGVAVDGSHIYWANAAGLKIGRANLDGSGADPNFIAGLANAPVQIAVNGSYIYWANNSPSGDGAIGRANLNGTGVDESFISLPSTTVFGVAVDGSYVYIPDFNGNRIERSTLDGKTTASNFITGASNPVGVAADSSHVFWTNDGTSTIGRANLDGSEPTQALISGASGPYGVTVDGSHVYWANQVTGTIGRASLDGSAATQSFITGASAPSGIAVDAGPTPSPGPAASGTAPPPDTSLGLHPKRLVKTKKPRAKVKFTFSSSAPGSHFQCSLDGGPFAACNSPKVLRIRAKPHPKQHTFQVRAVDAGGKADPTPATYRFKVKRVS